MWNHRQGIDNYLGALYPRWFTMLKKKMTLLFSVWLFVTPWTVTHQAPLSMGFPRQEYWSGLTFPSPGDLHDPGIRPEFPTLAGRFFTAESPERPKDNLLDNLKNDSKIGDKRDLNCFNSIGDRRPSYCPIRDPSKLKTPRLGRV